MRRALVSETLKGCSESVRLMRSSGGFPGPQRAVRARCKMGGSAQKKAFISHFPALAGRLWELLTAGFKASPYSPAGPGLTVRRPGFAICAKNVTHFLKPRRMSNRVGKILCCCAVHRLAYSSCPSNVAFKLTCLGIMLARSGTVVVYTNQLNALV